MAVMSVLKPFDLFGLKRLRISELIWVKDRLGHEVKNLKVLHPAASVNIALPADAEFLKTLYHCWMIDA